MLVIGLAGGVASGKSLVADCFKHFGAVVLDADRIGHEVLKDPAIIKAIVGFCGTSILKDGEINRKSLAKIVFDPSEDGSKALKQLEQITHPAIGILIHDQLSKLKIEPRFPAAVLDAPIMFKANWDQMCDKIVFVHADLSLRRKRASQRGWDAGEISRREAQQTLIDEKKSRCTDLIDNSQSRDDTYTQARDLWLAWGLVFPKQLDSSTTLFKN